MMGQSELHFQVIRPFVSSLGCFTFPDYAKNVTNYVVDEHIISFKAKGRLPGPGRRQSWRGPRAAVAGLLAIGWAGRENLQVVVS